MVAVEICAAKNWSKVVTVGFRVVAPNFGDLGDEALPCPALQLNEEVQGIGDIALDGDGGIDDLSSLLLSSPRSSRNLSGECYVTRTDYASHGQVELDVIPFVASNFPGTCGVTSGQAVI